MTTRSPDPLSFSSSSETVNKTRRKSRSDEKPALVVLKISRGHSFFIAVVFRTSPHDGPSGTGTTRNL